LSSAYFGILGPVEVTTGGTRLRIGGPREKKALAALLLNSGQVMSAERLVQILWDAEAPATARSQVHNTIARLRRNLATAGDGEGDGVIVSRGPTYLIQVAQDRCDATVFASRMRLGHALARDGKPAEAAPVLREALDLWRGRALDGLHCAYLDGEAQRLEEDRLVCLEQRIEVDLALGRDADLIGELAALVRAHPLRERLVELQLLALYRCGRRLEALDTFRETRLRLARETGLDPRPELDRLHRAILANDPALDLPAATHGPVTVTAGPGQLPGLPRRSLPSLVGRERDLADLPALLKESAVVTLIGPPGCGKTRLALEFAARCGPAFSAGVALVRLDMLQQPGGVAAAVLAVVEPAADPSSPPLDYLIEVLSEREALLVLDNCEHVASDCARLVEELTAHLPQLRVLATSQVPLAVAGERVYLLGPLSQPTGDTVDAVLASESGRLLVERAIVADPDFTLSTQNSAHIASACRALEGLPLAIELAAARLRAFSVEQIAERLDRQLELLAGHREASRHGSLLAAIEWSHDLLTERERRVFARLAVFLGGFTLEATEAVVADSDLSTGAAMDTLGALVERSLVVAEHRGDLPGQRRYRLLEALREYAAQRLDEAGESAAVRDRHARQFCALAEEADWERRGPNRRRWLQRLTEEYANLRAGMARAQSSGDHELCLRYACALTWFWRRHATTEALDWLRDVLQVAADAPVALRQRALLGAGSLALRISIDEARDYIDQAVALAHAVADPQMEVKALSFMASIEVYVANAAAVGRYGDRAVDLAREEGDPYLLARTLMARGLTRAHVGYAGQAAGDLAEAFDLFATLGDRLGMHEVRMARAEVALAAVDPDAVRAALDAIGRTDLAHSPPTGMATYRLCQGWLALLDGRFDDVRVHLREAVTEETDHFAGPYAAQRIFGPALDLSAGLALAEGDAALAVTLRHAATAVLTLYGNVPERPDVRLAGEVDRRAATQLTPEQYTEAAERGGRTRLVDALRYANLPSPRRAVE
jgi:predicted ATPase/DNA-binding SARP family transcriptional activator